QREKKFPSASGLGDCRVRLWIPDEVRGAVQLTHGLAEHIDRYEDFARYLADCGFLVYGMDCLGHGGSGKSGAPAGYFGEQNGWDHLISDIGALRKLVQADYPALPFVLLGQGFGSLLVRSYAARTGGGFQGYILAGTSGASWGYRRGKRQAEREIKKGQGMAPCEKLYRKLTAGYNKSFSLPRTSCDWLSRDTEAVDRYLGDPLCGFAPTAYGLRDYYDGLLEISNKRWAQRMPKRPVFLLSGARDPVGRNSKGVLQVEKWLRKSGHRVLSKLYPQGRHEMLHETNKQEVYDDILLFLEAIALSGERE
ncbi:MAG: lysophospholipase, partial [Clostridiales bacterium]|nr:lysophospholipase [Clostridiales bacterium]